ncbi:hypothetical protein ACUN0C_09930 [Faunimonas sp. B44]|uniref:hypothetical protein n=1 Tax=Faunimonas sp. B44 TaxID=3461493 RepID=UPI0040442A1F
MNGEDRRITITDIDIPFWRLVAIFIKFTLAAIPAYFVVFLIVILIMAVFGTIFGGMGLMMDGMWRM